MLLTLDQVVILPEVPRRAGAFGISEEGLLIDEVTLFLEERGSLGLVGDERSGKLSLVLAILGLIPISGGSILWHGKDCGKTSERQRRPMRQRIQTVFAESWGQLPPDRTIRRSFEEVLGLWFARENRTEWETRIEAAMVACGLTEALRDLRPRELDAVERQQAALARALLAEPDLIICHEWLSGLDGVSQAELLNLLNRIREDRPPALLFCCDDLAAAHQVSDTLGILHRGRLLEFGAAESLVTRPEHDYTRRLISCAG
jgi:peptide/nickel transport system ATP-binding protein